MQTRGPADERARHRATASASTSRGAAATALLEHGGEVSGFTASNFVFPDDSAAVTVLVNQDAIDASGDIAGKIATLLFANAAAPPRPRRAPGRSSRAFSSGTLDRSLFTANANSLLHRRRRCADFADEPRPARSADGGQADRASSDRGGMTFRLFEVKFPGKTLAIWERDMPDGKIEQFQVMAQ